MDIFKIRSMVILFFLSGSLLHSAPFVENGNGTVTDVATGLVWQKCSWGQTGSDCSGSSATFATWSVALNQCHSLTLASRSWRLPNVIELRSILDLTKALDPLVDTSAFPSTPIAGLYYWSSTTSNSFGANAARAVHFISGALEFDDLKNQSGYVRCVSGP
ncbi:DUF1566 domain-containing protein [Leptospira meyeri]|uniref:Lcl C-terminal domain-containing protein n=2 Tax=Leptospira meyeri TaxID=29508 RepID=UPI000C2A7C3F|nr:hypothetical protein CH359_01955 [Leptospira meyeri]PJZ98026.1 hypothetical protein CH358_03420 [Leptospira meyeri]TGM62633.1 DUF1566 domain-containing protein [Leptospira meyeri]TGM71063.1 DUF1566 domain-containing protein [Leptospira meyeri]